MAIISMREIRLNGGERAFHLGMQVNLEKDRRLYEACVALEERRFVKGSVSQQVFERLASGLNQWTAENPY